MKKRSFLGAAAGALLLAACTTTTKDSGSSDPASKRASIDAAVDSALASLYAQVPGSRDLVSKAAGTLVFPNVTSAGFIVGGSHGQGALRVGGKTNGYFTTTTGSVGWIIGAETKALYILFMTPESLQKFASSKGWTAGVDASVTMLSVGAEASGTTETAKQPVVGYVLQKGGLMANLSIDGTKIARIDDL